MVRETHLSFLAAPEKGKVSAILRRIPESRHLLVLAHGAGADMSHRHMTCLAQALGEQQISTFRFNFPFMESGGKRTDSRSICLQTISNALKTTRELDTSSSLILSGHSFGGRMGSHFAHENITGKVAASKTFPCSNLPYKNLPHKKVEIEGLVYFSFPLHPSKKPDIKRAAHLPGIGLPQLFISGTRDSLADITLLEPLITSIPGASLCLIDTADHSFKTLKKTRASTEDVYDEAARNVRSWIDNIMTKKEKT